MGSQFYQPYQSEPVSIDGGKERGANLGGVLALICVPIFIGALDLTIVSAFLPEILVQLELPVESSIDDTAWIVSGYLLAYTVSMTFMGRVSDLIGRRGVYVACLIIFAIGSVLVATAHLGPTDLLYSIYRRLGQRPDPNAVTLLAIIIGRIVQALGAGALVPVSLALVGDLFPPAKRAQPLGIIGAVDTLGWVLGHLYGGIMVKYFSDHAEGFVRFFQQIGLNWDAPDWRTLFWINLPITVIALALTWWALRNVPMMRAKGRFDLIGTLLIVGALICLVIGMGANVEVSSSVTTFDELSQIPPYAGPLLSAAAVLFVLFVLVERRIKDPLFDLHMFKQRNLSAGLITNLFVGFCLMIGLVSVPVLVNVRLLQTDATNMREAALQVGILLSALTVPMAIAAIPGGWLTDRIGYRPTAVGGLLLALVGFILIWQTWTVNIANELIAVEMALVGIGLGLTFSPISAAVINSATRDRRGAASALVIILRLLGMTVSMAGLTTFATQRASAMALAEFGATVVDPVAAANVYVGIIIHVLAELGLVGAVMCGFAAAAAMLLRGKGGADEVGVDADELSDTHPRPIAQPQRELFRP